MALGRRDARRGFPAQRGLEVQARACSLLLQVLVYDTARQLLLAARACLSTRDLPRWELRTAGMIFLSMPPPTSLIERVLAAEPSAG